MENRRRKSEVRQECLSGPSSSTSTASSPTASRCIPGVSRRARGCGRRAHAGRLLRALPGATIPEYSRRFAEERGAAWTAAHHRRSGRAKGRAARGRSAHGPILFPGAAAAIRRAAADVPVAIASGALGAEIRRVLDREQLTSCFTAIVAAEDTPVSKPAPDPYLRALALLEPALGGRVAARDCVAVEDSHWGLASARAARRRPSASPTPTIRKPSPMPIL